MFLFTGRIRKCVEGSQPTPVFQNQTCMIDRANMTAPQMLPASLGPRWTRHGRDWLEEDGSEEYRGVANEADRGRWAEIKIEGRNTDHAEPGSTKPLGLEGVTGSCQLMRVEACSATRLEVI